MDIKLTKEELRTISRALLMASIIAEENAEHLRRFETLKNKINRIAHENGCVWVEYDTEEKKHELVLEDLDIVIDELMESYDDAKAWTGLVHRLTMRDYDREHPPSLMAKPQDSDYQFNWILEHRKKYLEEIEKHGLDRFYVKE